MAAAVGALIVVAVGGLGAGAPTSDECPRIQTGLESALELVQFNKEPEDGLRSIYSDATRATQECPEMEGLAYVRVRTAELGRGALIGLLPPDAPLELRELAAAAVERFPKSARILTVEARVSGNAEVARRAVAADPKYPPARVALADILVQSGDWRSAETILANTPRLNATNDGLVVWALVKLEKGDARGALAKANQALTGQHEEPIEPDARDPRPMMRAHAVAARAALALRRFNDAALHLGQANPQDPLVREMVQDPPPQLAKALRARKARAQ